MKAMILAAGLGTRLKPWTLHHPKALVPVDGIPMLGRVIENLKSQGFYSLIVNVHHFSDQIVEYLGGDEFQNEDIKISDESDELLDTGGGILRAIGLMDGKSVLVHNVDILSTADLSELSKLHREQKDDITLLVSDRDSSRKLIFDENMKLTGWHNLKTGEYKYISRGDSEIEYAFSGIYILGPKALNALNFFAAKNGKRAFPIMDFLLSGYSDIKIRGVKQDFKLLDIGKPAALDSASEFIKKYLED